MRVTTITIVLCWLAGVAHAQEEAPPEQTPDGPVYEEPAEPPPPEPPPEPPARPETSAAEAPPSAPMPETTINTPPPRASEPEPEDEQPRGDPYDFFWIELQGGVSYVDLRAIDADNFYPEFVRLAGWGPAGTIAVGFRIEFLSVGLRASLARYEAGDASTPDAVFDVGTGTAEVTLAIPIPIVRPFARIGFGVGWHGDSNFEAPERSQTTVFGWVFHGAIGADIYLVDWFAIGLAVSIDILNMSRQTIDEPITDPGEVSFEDTGDAVGMQGRGTAGVSFHF